MSYSDYIDEQAIRRAHPDVQAVVECFLTHSTLQHSDSPSDERLRRYLNGRKIYLLTNSRRSVQFTSRDQWDQVKEIFPSCRICEGDKYFIITLVPLAEDSLGKVPVTNSLAAATT